MTTKLKPKAAKKSAPASIARRATARTAAPPEIPREFTGWIVFEDGEPQCADETVGGSEHRVYGYHRDPTSAALHAQAVRKLGAAGPVDLSGVRLARVTIKVEQVTDLSREP